MEMPGHVLAVGAARRRWCRVNSNITATMATPSVAATSNSSPMDAIRPLVPRALGVGRGQTARDNLGREVSMREQAHVPVSSRKTLRGGAWPGPRQGVAQREGLCGRFRKKRAY